MMAEARPDLSDTELGRFDLEPEPEADICIVGAGIAGLTTTLQLVRQGAQVTVLDDGPIGGGETARTSVHSHRRSTTATA
jgi:phytoene dehydrogenase-like protein